MPNRTLPGRRIELSLAVLAFVLAADGALAQDRPKTEIVPQIPHSTLSWSVAFSPDGARVLSGSFDHTLKLWDAATGTLIRTFQGHSSTVASVAFSPDGARVLSGSGDILRLGEMAGRESQDNTLKLWDAVTGALIRTFQGHSGAVRSVLFSPDGARVLSGSHDNTIKLWDTATGALIRTFQGHSGPVTSVAFSPDGTRVLSGSEDTTLKLWDAATGALIHTFQGHRWVVRSVAFSPDGTRVLSGSYDKTLKLWDAAAGKLIHTFEGQLGPVLSVAFSPDGARLLSASGDLLGDRETHNNTLKLWDAATGKLIRTLQAHLGVIVSAAFSPDGARVLSSSEDRTLKLWDAATGALIRTFQGHSDLVGGVAFSPEGARVLSGIGHNTLRLWDAVTGALIRTFQGHSGAVHPVLFSPDGARLLLGNGDGTLKLLDADTGALIRTFQGHSGAVRSVLFSPDGARSLSGSEDTTLKLWDADTGALIRTFQGHSGPVTSVAFSPDGTRVLSGSLDGTLKLWDAATGKLIRTFDEIVGVSLVAFSPDGTRVLGGHSMWDAATGTLIRTFQGRLSAVAPDSARVLSGTWDRTLKLWDVTTGALIQTRQGHSGWVMSVAFSPDGTRVLSGSVDHTLKLWDAATGALIHTFQGHSGDVLSVAFSPDGGRVFSGGADKTVRFWKAANGELLTTSIAGRNQEWLTITPQGFFARSARRSGNFLSIVRGLEAVSIYQLHQSLFNPDLVREALAGDPSGELREAAKVINLEHVLDSGPPPSVAITSPVTGSKSAANLLPVTARITDKGKGVGRIEWRVNGVTVAVVSKPTGSGPGYIDTQQLAVDPGDNTIEVVAYNGSNLLASLPARTTVKFTGPTDKTRPKLHVLAIGIDKYIDKGWIDRKAGRIRKFLPLKLAVKDAEAFGREIKRAGAQMYEDVVVKPVLDKDATRENLEKVVGKIAKEIDPRDTFILFAAAHGISEAGRFYLIPQDYQGGPGALQERAIGQDQLQNWLANRIRARKAIILLDTCESGALVAGHLRSRTEEAASEAGVGRLHEATGRPVLTAAATGQFAHEGVVADSGERHGVFTWALLDALRKGDTNNNRKIELSELVAYVQNEVPKIAAKYGGIGRAETATPTRQGQTARFGSRGEDFAVVNQLQ